MVAPCWPAVVPVDVTSLPSATSSSIAADQASPHPTHEGAYRFPKQNRLLRSKDFRFVYDNGKRMANPLFAGFCLCRKDLSPNESSGPRIGFTVPRALGNAVVRNRLRRRFREAVRLRLTNLNAPWSVVINPRRAAIECSFIELEREISRLFQWCSKQDCAQPL